MKGAHMIEKRCKIGIAEATFISVECHACKAETNIPMQARREVEVCGVCGAYFGESVVRYISNIKKTHMIQSEEIGFTLSLVSVEQIG